MSKPKIAMFILFLTAGITITFAYSHYQIIPTFEIYETYTHKWHVNLGNIALGLPTTFNVTVECKEETGNFLAAYFLEISGPANLCNDYLRLNWQDTDGAHFTIGKDGDQHFHGVETIKWHSTPTEFATAHKNNISLTLVFLTTEAFGSYKAKMWAAFTPKPIPARITITPKVLEARSRGKWINCYVSLPEPFEEKNINTTSVRLWWNDSSLTPDKTILTGNSLLLKFYRIDVLKMLNGQRGKAKLAVTGLVDDFEFYGAYTITIRT